MSKQFSEDVALAFSLFVLVVFFVLHFCSCATPETYQVFKVPVYVDTTIRGPTKTETTEAIIYFFNRMEEDFGIPWPILRREFTAGLQDITFRDGPIYYPDLPPAAGLYLYSKGVKLPASIVVAYSEGDCLAATALYHELMHHYLYRIITEWDGDKAHENRQVWEWLRAVRESFEGYSLACEGAS